MESINRKHHFRVKPMSSTKVRDLLATITVVAFWISSFAYALAPMVLTHPESQMIQTGATSSISVVVDVGGNVTYQWKKNGVDLPSTNSPTYTISNAQGTHAGNYTVVVSNAEGSCEAGPAVIFVGNRRTVFVKYNATGSNNGSSWTNAYTSLGTALANAIDGDDIWVSAGTYKPSTTGNRDSTFQISKFVRLYGGFSGSENTLNQRNWNANSTILSGDLSSNDTGLGGNQGDNSKRVVTVSSSSGAIIDGIKIYSGSNTSGGIQPDFGAGIGFLSGGYGSMAANALVRNCVFKWNSAISYGGAIGLWGSATTPLTIDSCTFIQNSAPANGGGAVQVDNCSLVVRDSYFDSNSTGGSGGGAITANNTRGLIICNSVFSGNSAPNGTGAGAVRAWTANAAVYRIIQSTFNSNTGAKGTIYCEGTPQSANCILANSIIVSPSSTILTFPVTSYILSNQTIAGTGNILGNPVFVNASQPLGADGLFGTADDGLALQTGSVGINAGEDSYVPSALSFDVTRKPRILQKVDLGAYEQPHLANGNFELPTLSNPDNLDVVGAEIMGWTKSGPGRLVLLKNVAGNLVPPKSGSQQLLFNSGNAAVGAIITAAIPTIPGRQYLVQFYVGRSGASSGDMGITSRARDSSGNDLFSSRFQAPSIPSYGSISQFAFTAATDSSFLSFEDSSLVTDGVDLLLDAVTVTPLIKFINQPQSAEVSQSTSIQFNVNSIGMGMLNYQWQKDGLDIPGATTSSFQISGVMPWHIGDYSVRVSDDYGVSVSEVAQLSVTNVNTGIWKGLVAFYPLNGNANDATLNVNHGTAYSSTTTASRHGLIASAWSFVGNVNSRITIPKRSQHDFTNEATVSIWAKFNEPWSYHVEDLIWNRPAFQNYGFGISVNQDDSYYGSGKYNYFGAGFRTNSGEALVNGPNVSFSEINRWNLVTITFQSGVIKSYVNGVLASTGSAGTTLVNGNSDLVIGGASNPVSGAYSRDIDDVRIYNRALSEGEVLALYNSDAIITPVLANAKSSQISATSTGLDCNVVADGGSPVVERGFVYSMTSINPDPIIGGLDVGKVIVSGSIGEFSAMLTGLISGTEYSFKAYALNSKGEAYTNVAKLTTLSTNDDLDSLVLDVGSLTPTFTSSTKDYTLTIAYPNDSIVLTPSTSQSGATVEIRTNGAVYEIVNSGSTSKPQPLKVGSNTLEVRVTAEDGVTQKVYTLLVTRARPVQNLAVEQRSGTRFVDLTYDLDVAAPVKITLEISNNGGQTYFVPAHNLSGDIGLNVSAGVNKLVTWDAGTDWSGNWSNQMRFRVVVDELDDEFAYIPEGPFTMGRTSGDVDINSPPVALILRSFYLQGKETTKAQWDEVRSWAVNNGYADLPAGFGKASNHPVYNVNWFDVVKWCNARSEKEGLTPVYTTLGQIMKQGTADPVVNWSANGYRLPTEAEWEKAGRGGFVGKRFPWEDDSIDHEKANYYAFGSSYSYDSSGTATSTYHPIYNDGQKPYTAPVGSFAPNRYGLYDMVGNVNEWCWDWYSGDYYNRGVDLIDPRGPATGTQRLRRGGSWSNFADFSRLSFRFYYTPDSYYNTLGFRLASSSIPGKTFPEDSQSVTIDTRISQSIAFTAISDKQTTDSVTLSATGGGSGNPVTFAVTSGPASITNGVLTFTTSGSVTITASQAGNANYLAAPDVSRTFNVTKAAAAVTLGSLLQTFNGTPRTAMATTDPAGLTVEFTYDGSSTAPANAGRYEVVASVDDLIYQGSATGTLEIGKASQSITFAAITDKLTTDSVTLSATGGGSGNPVTFAVTSGPASITNAVLAFTTSGSVTITASQAGNANYLAAPDVSRTFNVTKATAAVTLGGLAQTYNGTQRAVTAATTPAGLTVKVTYDGSLNAPTDAGSYEVVATVDDLIYQGSATGTLEIGKASQGILFAAITDKLTTDSVNLSATGGGSSNPVTFAVTSGPASITNGVLTFTTSGSVTITASQAGNANYLAAPYVSRTFNVTKATAAVTLGSLVQTFNGTPRTATATTDPAGLTVEFTYDGSSTAPANAGSYEVVGTINDPIYQGSAAGTLEIGKAFQSIIFAVIPDKLTTDSVNLSATGGGSGNPVTFAVSSGPAAITNGVLTFTTSGSVTITASQAGNANYLAAPDMSRTFNVTKATAAVTLGSLVQTFNGTPRTATATTDPAGLTVEFSYDGSPTAPTNAGSYAVLGTINDPIYQGSATGTLEIGKAAQSITFAAIPDKLTTDSVTLSATGGGSGNPVTFAVTSGPASITNGVLAFTTSGSVTITASQAGNANYLAAPDVSRTFNVTKATAAVTLGGLSQTYNGTQRAVTAAPTPAGLTVKVTYDGSFNAPTDAGSYEVVATVDDLIYQGSATGTLEIGKASQGILFAAITDKLTTDSVNLSATGGGSSNPVTFAVTSGPASITNGVLTFATSGSVTITASQAGNSNYLAAPDVSRTFNVTKATAAVTLGSLVQTFNGTPRTATATTDPAGLTVEFTYDGSSTAPANAGSYEVVGTISNPIYQGSAAGTLEIGKAAQSITFAAIPDKLTTDSVTLSATGGGSGNPVTFAVSSGPAAITNGVLTFTTSGSVTITASQAGSSDYFAADDVSCTFNVIKTTTLITFSQLVQVADGSPRNVSVSTTPVHLTINLTYAGQASPPSLPGTYEVSATLDDLIYQGTASSTLTVLGLSCLDQPVLSGTAVSSFANGTDFGNVTIGRLLTRVFTINNPGTTPISLTGSSLVQIEGENIGDFNVSMPPDAIVPPAGSSSFELRFAPTQPGIREASVKIASSNLSNGPITFAIQGFGALPTPRGQTITFNPPTTVYLSQSPLTLSATSSSGLPVEMRLISGNATLSPDGQLMVPVAGAVKVEARQAGNGSFAAAASVQRTITVKADPIGLTLVDLVKTYNGQPQEVGVVGAGEADVAVTYKVVGTVYRTNPPTEAGQYAVKAVAGTVTKTGTLIINPAPLYVNVEDKRRLVGESNPALTVHFEGFMGEETLSMVLTKPISLATTATAGSPVGSYPITSSGGLVTSNYRLVHRPGTLVVEGVAGSYEALLKRPGSALPNGHLTLTVPGASRTLTASLRMGLEPSPISWTGSLKLSAEKHQATATLTKTVAGTAYELKIALSMFGELECEVKRAGDLVAESEDGIRLLNLPTGQKAPQEGAYTAVLEPATPSGTSVPAGAGWATGKVDAKGQLKLTGRLGDGTSFTSSLAADVAEKPGYRLFVQPYVPSRKDSYLAGSFMLTPHPRVMGKSYVAGSTLSWVKAGLLKDLGYRSGFGPLTTTLRLDPWQPPTSVNRLAARLELGSGGLWEVQHSAMGSLSEGALPTQVGLSSTNVVSVVTPATNRRNWKVILTPSTGAFTGSFELLDLTEVRKVNFSGVLRQTPALADDLIGGGHYLLPALKSASNTEQKAGAVLFWRPE